MRFFVVAPGTAPKSAPAVLWVHWLGEVATTNDTEFMSDAQALAKRGVVSMLAADDRPAYAVLMAPALSYWEWYLLGKQPADPAAYVARMSAFDLPGWLARGKQKATLLQFGRNDEYVAQATAIALRNAVPNRDRTFTAYKLDHALVDVTAHDDRVTWPAKHLGV